MKRTTTVLFLISMLVLLSVSVTPVAAFTMSNDNFIIDMGDFNEGSGTSSNSKSNIQSTIGQTAPGLYSGKNYSVKLGFTYIYPLSPFTFEISESNIDFGAISATTPISRTTRLKITNNAPTGYRVLAYEDHPLIAPNGASIPDTTCDNGSCTETVTAPWENTLTYGFGYRCDNISGSDCQDGFQANSFYKQFADNSKHETMQAIMSGKGRKTSEVKITYKLNVSGTQPPGSYANAITYLAVPSY